MFSRCWKPLLVLAMGFGLWLVVPILAQRESTAKEEQQTVSAHQGWISGLAYAPQGNALASIGEDGQLHFWAPQSGKRLRSYKQESALTALAYHPEGKHLALGAWDKTLRVIDISTGKTLQTLRGHRESITCVAYSPTGKVIASGSGDDTLRLWDATNGKLLHTIELDDDYDVTCVAFSPDGQLVAGGDGEKRLTLWDVASGEEVRALEGHEAALSCVAFAPDGKHLVTGSWDQTLRLWEVASGRELRTFRGHRDSITAVAFDATGSRFASASEDGTVRVWEVTSGKEIGPVRKMKRGVVSVAFRPDGRQLASGSKEVLTLWPVEESATAGSGEMFREVVQPFLKRHCVECHGPRKQLFGIRLDTVEGFAVEQIPLWTRVHEVLREKSMPPEEKPRPEDAERDKVLAWIAAQQKAAPIGQVRRLNRREFSAALQDVTGLKVDYAYALPADAQLGGFDTGIDTLQDSGDSVEQWMKLTRRAVDAIRFREPARETPFVLDLRGVKDVRKAFDGWKTHGATFKARGQSFQGKGMLLEPRWVGERDVHSFQLPTPRGNQGVLRLRLVVSAFKSRPELPSPHLWVEVSGKDVAFEEITASPEQPRELIYEVQLEDLAIGNKGVKVALSNKVEVPYRVEGYENEDLAKPEDKLPEGTGLFRPRYDRNKTAPEAAPAPFIIVHEIAIDTDYVAAWPPASWKKEAIKGLDDRSTAKHLLNMWMERAWRRPIRDGEADRFLALYAKLREEKVSFDAALRASFQAVLMSGPFRYLASPGDADRVVAAHALASRLSFLLWGAPPDAELRRLAAAGTLAQPEVMAAQMDRLVADPRSDGFLRPFVLQWLEMEQPITIAQSSLKKQDFRFARYLKASMREETLTYVSALIRENRPARELISSDWTMMNDSLAHHYGYEGISGGQLRKVKLRKDDPRGGGVMSHAGIQSMLTWMGGNWVIYRGAWAMRHLLDEPPPPPPLEVPELNPHEGKNRGKTFKQLLQQHQENPNCALCHRKMDPLGFAFQNFDLSGRWRDEEFDSYATNDLDGRIEWRGVGKARPVDSTGQLPRGERFRTFAECKSLMERHYQKDLMRGLLKNWLIYSTGRLPNVHDLATIRELLKRYEAKEYPLREMLRALLQSPGVLGHT